jgi:hypothetical protein
VVGFKHTTEFSVNAHNEAAAHAVDMKLQSIRHAVEMTDLFY